MVSVLVFRGVGGSFPAFHGHGDAFTLPEGAGSLARSAQAEPQAVRYGDTAYGLLCRLEVILQAVAWMTTAFQDERAEGERDGIRAVGFATRRAPSSAGERRWYISTRTRRAG